jgi:hypothetical protein
MPKWVAVAFFVGCAIFVPQIIHLTNTLPRRAIANHWRAAWVVLDIGEAIAIALTGWFLVRRSAAVIVSGSMAAALLWTDAWFDVATSVGRGNITTAIVLAVLVELPLSGLCLFAAVRHLRIVRLADGDETADAVVAGTGSAGEDAAAIPADTTTPQSAAGARMPEEGAER